ncbi:MAG: hypothetical protein AB1571_02500 [Nanoarchaeota archaeon]
MKINKYLFYILIIFVFISIIWAIYTDLFIDTNVYRIIELEMDLKVGDYVGFNVNTDKIYFGIVPKGASSKRIITITNFNISSNIIIEKKGEFADWVYLDEKTFLMKPNEIKNITVTVTVPKNAKYGNYTSKLKILFARGGYG